MSPCNAWLSGDRRLALLTQLVSGVTGTVTTLGVLSGLNPEEQSVAVAAFGRGPELVADLFLAAFAPQGKLKPPLVFAWQSLLARALGIGVARGRTEGDQKQLEKVAAYQDDEHWQERTRQRVGIPVRLRHEDNQPWLVFDDEPSAVFDDARVAQVVAAWFTYTAARPGSRLSVRYEREEGTPSDDDWRVALTLGGDCYTRWPGSSSMVVSAKALTPDVLDAFADGSGTIRELFPDAPLQLAQPA